MARSRLSSFALVLSCASALSCHASPDALAQPAGPPPRQDLPFSGGLPQGWRMLGDDEPAPGEPFDFDRDGSTVPARPPDSFFRPTSPVAPNYDPARSGLPKAAPPVKDEAALKAERDRARAEALKKAMAPRPDPAALRRQALDALFTRLAAAQTPQEAQPVAVAIQRILGDPRSDTASLVMQRARAAAEAGDAATALALLDRLVAIEPNWAQAWTERAAARLAAQDVDGAMADVDKALRLEPRDFGALLAMGEILRRVGLDRRALEAYEKALAIYPAQPELRAMAEKLSLSVRGRDI
ncbi:hypothetical protein [Methylocella sp.]|uniref:hypothetical protein n=1 Tax=Methylocella sp. TaxID=1978226 RepID=UPI0037845288